MGSPAFAAVKVRPLIVKSGYVRFINFFSRSQSCPLGLIVAPLRNRKSVAIAAKRHRFGGSDGQC